MKAKYNYELIKDYLDGMMESEAAAKIEILLREDEIARDIAKGILILEERFEKDDEKIDNYLEDLLKKNINTLEHKKKPVKRSFLYKIAASVALLAVVSILAYQYTFPNVQGYVDSELSNAYPALSQTRGTEAQADYQSGMQLYTDGRYEEAAARFNKLDNAVGIFYGGLCKLYLKEYDSAIVAFKDETLQSSAFQPHSQWFLSLAYLKVGENESAISLLSEISASEGFKSDEAERLLNLLEN